jgi:hypothetical protein
MRVNKAAHRTSGVIVHINGDDQQKEMVCPMCIEE